MRGLRVFVLAAALLVGSTGCAALRSALASAPAALDVADMAARTYLQMRDDLPVAPPPQRPAADELLALLEYLAQMEGWCSDAQKHAAEQLVHPTGALARPELVALLAELAKVKARAADAQKHAVETLAPP